jgi:hypothetical protein
MGKTVTSGFTSSSDIRDVEASWKRIAFLHRALDIERLRKLLREISTVIFEEARKNSAGGKDICELVGNGFWYSDSTVRLGGRRRNETYMLVSGEGNFSQCILIPHRGYLKKTPLSSANESSCT